MIKLNTRDKKHLDKTLSLLQSVPEEIAQEELDNMAIDTIGYMKRDAPVDTGNLRQNIKFEQIADGVSITSEALDGNTDYAPIQEYGTRFINAQPYFWKNVRRGVRELRQSLMSRIKQITNRK